jgi:hypothetical protein
VPWTSYKYKPFVWDKNVPGRPWKVMVEAAGVEPDKSVENAQLIDSWNA